MVDLLRRAALHERTQTAKSASAGDDQVGATFFGARDDLMGWISQIHIGLGDLLIMLFGQSAARVQHLFTGLFDFAWCGHGREFWIISE